MQETQDSSSVLELGKSPGGGHNNPFQCTFLENPVDRGDWRVMVHSVAELDRTEAT